MLKAGKDSDISKREEVPDQILRGGEDIARFFAKWAGQAKVGMAGWRGKPRRRPREEGSETPD